jgi:hypothetical protein
VRDVPFGFDPVALSCVLLVAGLGLLLHGDSRRRGAVSEPTPSGRWFLAGPRRFLFAYLNLSGAPLPGWAQDRPDVFLELFYGAALVVAGIGGILLFPR